MLLRKPLRQHADLAAPPLAVRAPYIANVTHMAVHSKAPKHGWTLT